MPVHTLVIHLPVTRRPATMARALRRLADDIDKGAIALEPSAADPGRLITDDGRLAVGVVAADSCVTVSRRHYDAIRERFESILAAIREDEQIRDRGAGN